MCIVWTIIIQEIRAHCKSRGWFQLIEFWLVVSFSLQWSRKLYPVESAITITVAISNSLDWFHIVFQNIYLIYISRTFIHPIRNLTLRVFYIYPAVGFFSDKLSKTKQVSPEWLRSNIMLLEECSNIHEIGSYQKLIKCHQNGSEKTSCCWKNVATHTKQEVIKN